MSMSESITAAPLRRWCRPLEVALRLFDAEVERTIWTLDEPVDVHDDLRAARERCRASRPHELG
jgi:hypothetical protein